MTGYRRVEPTFCRGCGAPWTPGADACPKCAEVLWRPPAVSDDPLGVPRLRAVVIAALAVVTIRWGALLAIDDWELVAADAQRNAYAIPTLAALLIVVTARLWYPGALPGGLFARGSGRALLLAIGLGVLIPAGAFAVLGAPAMAAIGWGGDLEGGVATYWLALPLVAIVVEEMLLRGLFFSGIARISGERQAAAASVVMSLLLLLDPVSLVLAVAAAALRVGSGAVGPAICVRLVATIVWLTYAVLA